MREVSLESISGMKYGKMPPKNILNDSNEGYPIYSGYRVTGYAKEFLYKDEMLIIVARGVGGTGDVKISPEQSWITNLSIVLTVDEEQVDKYYLKYLLNREKLKDKLNTGAAQSQITIDSLSRYKIKLPELNIQKRIADIILSYEGLIENNRRRIKLLEESSQLLYKEWFVHLRFPSHEHIKIIDGIPGGWSKEPLGNLLTLQRGFDLPSKARKNGSIPIYASTGINGFHNEAKVKRPGVITGRSGSLGKVMYVSREHWPLNTTLWVKEFKKVTPIISTFILRSLKLENYNGGAAVPTLNRNDVHKIDVLCPTGKLIREFDLQVEILFQQIEQLTEYNQKLAKARDILIPCLMNGDLVV